MVKEHCTSPDSEKYPFSIAFQALSRMDRVIYGLHKRGMPTEVIAMLVNCTESTVHTKIQRIHRLFRKYVVLPSEGLVFDTDNRPSVECL